MPAAAPIWIIKRVLALAVLLATVLAVDGHVGSAAGGRTLYVAPTGGSAPACPRASPCGSFQTAYDRARPGDTVEIAAGTYAAPQSLSGDKGSTTPIVVRAAAGQPVVVQGSLDIRSDYADVRGPIQVTGGVDVENTEPSDPIVGVRISGVSASSSYLQNVRDLTFRNSNLTGVPGRGIVMIGAFPTSYRVTFDNMAIHGNVPVDPDTHLECVFVTGIQGFTVRNSQFSDCGYFDILIGLCCGAEQQPSALVLENNHFGKSRCFAGSSGCPADGGAPFSLMLGTRITGSSRIVGNTFDTQPATQTGLSDTFESLDAFGNSGSTPRGWNDRATRLTTAFARTPDKALISGEVTPALPGSAVTVTLYKRVKGSLRKVLEKQVALSASSRFSASYPATGAGTCLVTVRFPGSSFMNASNARRLKFRC